MSIHNASLAASSKELIPGNPRFKSFAKGRGYKNMIRCQVCGDYFDPGTPGATYDDHLTKNLTQTVPGGINTHQSVVAALDPEPDLLLAAAHNASGVVVAWDMPRSWFYVFNGVQKLLETEPRLLDGNDWVGAHGEGAPEDGWPVLFMAPDPAGRIMTYGGVSFDARVGYWWLGWMFTPKPFRGAGYERRAAVGLRQVLGEVSCSPRQQEWLPEVLEVLDGTAGWARSPAELVASGDGWTAT